MKKATLQRISDDGKETKGTLRSGTFVCDTLELPYKDNAHNISCIPAGTYTCNVSHMGNMNIDAYLLSSVAGRSGIFIHPGNYAFGKQVDTEGCILVGNAFEDRNGDGTDDVVNSRITFAKFMGFFANEPIELTIVDVPQALKLTVEPVVEIGGDTEQITPAPSNPLTQFSDWVVTSSANPDETSKTIQGVLLLQAPVILSVLKGFGINTDGIDILHAVGTLGLWLGIGLTAFGLGRKIYYQFKK